MARATAGAEPAERTVRLALVGDSCVGKTSLLMRYSRDTFDPHVGRSERVEFVSRRVQIGDTIVNVACFDTAGQEEYHALVSQYFRGLDGALLVFDITREPTFLHAADWMNRIRTHSPQATVLVVGNKLDLRERRQVPRLVAVDFAHQQRALFQELSAREPTCDVRQAFHMLIEQVLVDCEARAAAARHESTPAQGGAPLRLGAGAPAPAQKRCGSCA